MTLLEHLRQGEWNEALPLINRALRAGVRVRHVPPPWGHTSWRHEDYEELLAEFVADGRGPARLIQLAVSATDDQHVRGLLGTTIKRFLADRARGDPLPKLRRTLRAVLERMPEAVFVDKGTVALAPHCEQDRWAGDETELLAVATALTVAAPPWGQDTIREGPPTDRASFESLCTAILDAAGGPVALNALTRTIGRRLQLRRTWDDRLDDEGNTGVIAAGTTPISASATVVAVEIWDQLTDEERTLMTYLDAGGRQASRESGIGLGKSAAQVRLGDLKGRMALLLDGITDRSEVVRALIDLHARWDES